MKMLVIGMDGANEELLRSLPMPFTHSLLNASRCVEVSEDLFSRGWTEIVSGVHGRDTGAFYYRPTGKGTHKFTQRYRLADFYNSQTARPLWDIMSERNVPSGFMNIPTTFPAPETRGFFISGAGAGLKVIGGQMPEGSFSPPDLGHLLSDNKYVLDLRLMAAMPTNF